MSDAPTFLRELANVIEHERSTISRLYRAVKSITGQDGHIWHGGNSECTPECQEHAYPFNTQPD